MIVIHGFLVSREAGIFDLENPLVVMKPALRAANALSLAGLYALRTFLPIGLSADHSAYALRLAESFREGRAYAGIAFLAALLALAITFWRRRPLAALGTCLFAGSLFPVSNVPFVIGTIWAERLAYLPSAGLAALAAGLLRASRSRCRGRRASRGRRRSSPPRSSRTASAPRCGIWCGRTTRPSTRTWS